MFQEFKKRWEALMFLVGVGVVLVVAWQWVDVRLKTVEDTPIRLENIEISIQKLEKQIEASIQILENRIRKECKLVAEYQKKDFDSLLKITVERQKMLGLLQEPYWDMEQNPNSDPVFVALKEMKNNWREIQNFLAVEQDWYDSVKLECVETPTDTTSPGGN